jgi:hypothetical protein
MLLTLFTKIDKVISSGHNEELTLISFEVNETNI